MEAKLVHRMCQAFQTLPDAGGVLDQSVEVLRMFAVLHEGGYFGEGADPKPAAPPRDPFAGIPMVTL